MIVWTILSWIMSAIALAGTVLNAEQNIYGFVFWLVSNMYMTIRFFYIGEHAQALLFLVYTVLAVRGIISWAEKDRKAKAIKIDTFKLLERLKEESEKEQKNKKL